MTVNEAMEVYDAASLDESEAMLHFLEAKDTHALYLAAIRWAGALLTRNLAWDALMAEFRMENAA